MFKDAKREIFEKNPVGIFISISYYKEIGRI